MTIRGLQEGVGIALRALRQSKIRTGLTVLGVAVGVLVVVVMAAVIQGVNDAFDEAVDAAGPNTFYVIRAQGEVGTQFEEEQEFFTRPVFSANYARELRHLPSVENAYPYSDMSWMVTRLRVGDNEVEGRVVAVPPEFMEIDPGDIVEGRFYTGPEEASGRPVAVIDSATARDLYAPFNAVGRSFRIGNQNFRVVGIYKAPPSLFTALVEHQVFVPFRTGQKYLMRNARFVTFDQLVGLVVAAKPAIGLFQAVDQVVGQLRTLRGLGPGDSNNFEVWTRDQVYDWWNKLTGVLFAVMFALSSAGLMVGGVGVIAVMVVSVTERTREIGIRKALGATRRDVMWQFLVEAATLTTLGGAFGMAAGGLIAWAIGEFTPIRAVMPIWSIFVALAAAAFTGIVFGLYPAVRAARLDPIVALRYE